MAIPFAPILGKLSNNVGKDKDEIEDKLLFINNKLYQVNSNLQEKLLQQLTMEQVNKLEQVVYINTMVI